MDSRQVSQICKGVSEWHPFNEETVKSAPKQSGIYIFRMAQSKCFERLKGETDILYIGSTEGKHGLRGRLQQYLHPGPTQWTNKRIHAMAKKYDMEIAWCLCGEASNLELQLLRRYFEDHDELPPLNHASKRLLKKLLTGTVGLKGTLILEHRDKDGNLIKRIEG
ncbi:hypothetical protein COZ60_02940 [Candidatus Bathyarchaeota archaeon CG_4_8_14_3_um_filter_42_8]|jgi:hypothetical protein|nr:MAG: hypothetical protein COZ60_02940 [Candidatus Bathyarchaeota archaeon CG_4_8_14_3_um_filter_42_8]